ncbi:hypothetical protein [Woodsholea maritima]|uniref:hypothetical protein n=1 Tax=Woodsholea maritima TaxID=240237 RepID=UPI00037267D1|nr:hypothetical protein [Woodsholea maritima]
MRFAALLTIAGLALSGCSTVGDALDTPEQNAGPCPNALSLYDAHRVVEFQGEAVAYDNVGYTGEILNVGSLCRYVGSDPIVNNMQIRFAFGRGPAAEGMTHTYHYFVAVTRTDLAVIERQTFPIEVRFEPGQNRVERVESFDNIVIPRATETTSGANFEILVGFELSEEQLEFNRSGQRFRVSAGSGD